MPWSSNLMVYLIILNIILSVNPEDITMAALHTIVTDICKHLPIISLHTNALQIFAESFCK